MVTKDLNILYKEIIEIQKETIGATFILGFSTKRNKHYLYFNNKSKRFEDDSIENVLISSIEWIRKERVEKNKELKYSMFNR
jgi:hypothetical protein